MPKDLDESLLRRRSPKGLDEGLQRRRLPKDLDEGLQRRRSPKDLVEGLLRRSSMDDLGKGGISEGLKSVDSIINISLHCNFSHYSLFGLRQYIEKFIEITS